MVEAHNQLKRDVEVDTGIVDEQDNDLKSITVRDESMMNSARGDVSTRSRMYSTLNANMNHTTG